VIGLEVEARPPVERFPVGRRLGAAFVYPRIENCPQPAQQLRAYHLFDEEVTIFSKEGDLVWWKHPHV
jgi:hypothetical protein